MRSRGVRRHHEQRIKSRVRSYYGGLAANDPRHIGKLYFTVLCCYTVFSFIMLLFVPGGLLLKVATNIFNYALGFSCWHALAVNLTLLPRELRPCWFVRVAMFLGGTFFLTIAGLTTYTAFVKL